MDRITPMYKVGDLFQAKTGFIGEWIDNKFFIIADIETQNEDPYLLCCLENGRTLRTTYHTLSAHMLKY